MYPECAQKFVGLQRLRPQDFCKLATPDPAIHFQLPQPITRVHEAHCKRKIALGLRLNRGDAVGVQGDRGFSERGFDSVLRVVRRYAAPHVNRKHSRDHRHDHNQAKKYPF